MHFERIQWCHALGIVQNPGQTLPAATRRPPLSKEKPMAQFNVDSEVIAAKSAQAKRNMKLVKSQPPHRLLFHRSYMPPAV